MPANPDHGTVGKVLFTALDALRPYLSDLVLVGGWVPQVYAWAEDAEPVAVLSFDVDAAVPGSVPVRGGKSISEVLRGAGFEQRTTDTAFVFGTPGAGKAPVVTEFAYLKGNLDVPIEIIAPLKGRGEVAGVAVQKGLVVPALRFTDILLAHTRKVTVRGETLEGKRRRLSLRVPTLAAFVFARGLIFPRRRELEKRGKDLAYIYEVLKRPDWRQQVADGLPRIAKEHPANWHRTFRRNLNEAFKTQGSRGPAWVALQYPNRPADEVRKESFATFRAFLDE
ncbi:MAG: hypothetical protein ABII00_14170 [Elusimicrobiota bacterium]